MPYESFRCSHQLSIRGLVQDRQTGSWRYLIRVKRVLLNGGDDNDGGGDAHGAEDAASTPKPLWRRRHSSSFAAASPNSASAFGAGNVYDIRRSFAEFRLLHAAMKPTMRCALPSLPQESILAFFLGETQTMLQRKRLALENLLIAVENHSAASDSAEYLAFLARTDTYAQVSGTLTSPPASSAEDLAPRRYHSHDAQHQQRQRGRRRVSIESASAVVTDQRQDADMQTARSKEHRVDFHRYSLV